ncbi:MAG: peptide/nickel transport system substrate-binding protein, partial [Nocardioidaceae bacterium]|nr:peptide/nickel transport system substrate-binding protein [Nocardioidaceae bacterium]
MQYSLYQQLMSVPAGQTQAVGDAAQSCDFNDPQTVTCKLRPGLKFSNGDALTSSDVKFSFERNLKIADPNGASVLLYQLSDPKNPGPMRADAIDTPDDTTVVFHLNTPDQTFIQVLSGAATSIVDEDKFPADKLLGDQDVIGSGPYKLSQFKAGEQAVLEANANYSGDRKPASSQVFIQYFKDSAPLKEAIDTGQIDVAWRTLSPTDLNDLNQNSQAKVIEGQGAEFRYWVFDFKSATAKQLAVRQAIAYLIDRDTIAKDAYDGTVTPTYSIVPPGFSGHKDSFKTMYGAQPNPAAAKKALQDAGIKTPVPLTIGYTTDHYGPNSVDEATELASELDDSGLFKTKTESAEWEQYQTLYKQKAYDIWEMGWYPDFLDADNYLSPLVRDGGFFANGYSNPQVNKLLDKELADQNPSSRAKTFGQLQDVVAKDIPLIPSWVGKNVAVAGPNMNGVLQTLDPTYIFRLWEISKSS